jgi:hypothetical protein
MKCPECGFDNAQTDICSNCNAGLGFCSGLTEVSRKAIQDALDEAFHLWAQTERNLEVKAMAPAGTWGMSPGQAKRRLGEVRKRIAALRIGAGELGLSVGDDPVHKRNDS